MHQHLRLLRAANILGDVIKDSVSSFLVLQPLANKNAGRRGVEFAAAEHTVTVAHVVLEGSIIDLPASISTHTDSKHSAGETGAADSSPASCSSAVASCSSPVRAHAVHPAVFPVTFVEVALVEGLAGSDEFTKPAQTKTGSASGACCHVCHVTMCV